jgi:DNA-binding MarR family transcriptional regulator
MHVQVLAIHVLSEQLLHPHGIMRAVMGVTQQDRTLAEWRDLFDRHARVTCALEHELQHGHGLGVSEFEVLERLATCPDGCGRMQELAEAVHLSQSALSRLVGRLEASGLISRAICSEDRRGIFAHITDAGRERYAAAQPTHRAVLAQTLGD